MQISFIPKYVCKYVHKNSRDLYIAKNKKLCQNQNSKWRNFAKAEKWQFLKLPSMVSLLPPCYSIYTIIPQLYEVASEYVWS